MSYNQTVLITGGAQGIGKGITRYLLQQGYAIVIADIDPEAGNETMAEYQGLGSLLFIHTDIADEEQVQSALARTEKEMPPLRALINNAALANACSGPLEQLPLALWNRVLAINLTGPMLCSKYAAPALRRTKGSIVNIASTRALQSEPDSEAYAASKGGLVSLTHALALSLGPEIRVNCISPGWIETRDWQKASRRRDPVLSPADHTQHPGGRVGQPADIAALAAFLLSDAAGFITGQNYVVDGGMTRKMIYVE
ncbi:MAG: SDR family oxidoreductase [bacterium]|nr:SDR family oxidoreductase [bacterium]